MSIIKEVAKRLGAKDLTVFMDSNGYQGVSYYVLKRDSKYTVVSLHFGTCALCDWQMGLADDYRDMNPGCSYSDIPISVYEPIIANMVDEANEIGFHDPNTLMIKFDMIFGVGYGDTMVQEEITNYLRSNP